MSQFREGVSLQTRKMIVSLLPTFEQETLDESRGRGRYNNFLSDLFGQTRLLAGFPDAFPCASMTLGDRRHLCDDDCQHLVRLLNTHFESFKLHGSSTIGTLFSSNFMLNLTPNPIPPCPLPFRLRSKIYTYVQFIGSRAHSGIATLHNT